MLQLIDFFDWLLALYMWIVIGNAIMSWLVAFDVVNPHSQFVAAVGQALYRMTEPVLGPIRRFVPSIGGLDLSPVVALIAIVFVRQVLLGNLAASLARF